MDFFSLLLQLLNFAAPAFWVALLLTLLAWIFTRKRPDGGTLVRQFAINFVVSLAVLVGGLVLTGHDGRMLTYAALVLAVASSQWWMSRR